MPNPTHHPVQLIHPINPPNLPLIQFITPSNLFTPSTLQLITPSNSFTPSTLQIFLSTNPATYPLKHPSTRKNRKITPFFC